MFKKIIGFSINRPKIVMVLAALAVLVSIAQFPRMKVDTDPENMLPEDEFVRIFHHDIKREFALYDFIVLGVVNDQSAMGVFTPETLEKIYAITEKTARIDGVIAYELISPSTKDDIQQDGLGTVRFRWLMGPPPYTAEESAHIRDRAKDNPMFDGTVVSEDGKAICIYVPVEEKDQSYRISREIREIIKEYGGEENYHITGLPVAEDTFGFEMFKQMAISAPLAMFVIFVLMLAFFKNAKLVLVPLVLAGITVFTTMGLLIGLGFKVHIMSSMIPIFLMPIAVLDSVHILSEFFEKYNKIGDRKKAVIETIDGLFMPMLFTSLTTTAGFFSLAFARIPPVQVFGVFVAIGVMTAWLLTITFIPASVALMKKEWFLGFGVTATASESSRINRILESVGRFSLARWRYILTAAVFLVAVSLYGITRIVINDNPVKWFTPGHEIRIADDILNEHFGGTYTAYLVLEAEDKENEVFKEPEMLRYTERMQEHILKDGDVGKTTSLADVTKKIYYELLGGDKKNNVIPDTKEAVAQCLMSYQNSHKPDDLWHFTTPDYSKINIWFQLKTGDNVGMTRVEQAVKEFMFNNPPPFPVETGWAGLTYINVVWQNRMVVGMLMNFLGSFIIVLFMMVILFRSPARGLISMVPLSVTIIFIYSLLGFIGKNYDMPVAVLSALTLGLSIDFAIHFIERAREIYAVQGTWDLTVREIFREPARAILKNAMVISIGFLPLLAAPLVPYKTVGAFMFLIMLTSSAGTLILLPAIISAFPEVVFSERKNPFCRRPCCMIFGAMLAFAAAYVLRGYTSAHWGGIIFVIIFVLAAMSGICNLVGGHKICVDEKEVQNEEN
ncbi:MAG: MMPL family transporter [Candidatus Omnitrophota bacterium]